MNINKKSWHYKYNLWMRSGNEYKMPKTLCSYFWSTVFGIFGMTILIIMSTVLFGMCGFGIANHFFTSTILIYPFSVIIGLFMISLLFAIAIGIAYSMHLMHKKIISRKKYKSDNVVIEYIKAKKSKVCPLIEYKD